MIYLYDAITLFVSRRISWATLKLAIVRRPVAVCGRYGAEVICRKTARDLGAGYGG